MSLRLSLLSTALLLPASAELVINEVLGSTTSNDTEFIELYNPDGAPVDLTDWTLEVFESDAGGSFGTQDMSLALTGASVPAGGFLLIGSPEFQAQFGLAPDFAMPDGFLENSSYTLILRDASGSIAYSAFVTDGGDGDAANDAGVAITPDITAGPDGTFLPAGYALTPDGGTGFALLEFSPIPAPSATPGASNGEIATGSLALSLSAETISESAGATTLTVTRLGSTAGELTVTLSLDDPSEAMLQGSEVILFDGEESTTIDLDAVDDLWPDGDQTVTITASALNFGSAETPLTVQDDGDTAGLVFNEVYMTPDYLDANGDGSSGFGDAFVEILNAGAAPVDLSYFTLRENGYDFRGEVHFFPEGTVLAPGSALVVFGGGEVDPGTTAAFGNAEVQLASSGGLFLSSDGEQLSLRDQSDLEVAGVILPDVTASPDDGSFTLATDGDLASGYVRHTTTGPATDFSPGTQVDGTPFATVSQALTVTINTATVVENAGSASGALTVMLPGNATADTVIRFSSSDPSELLVQDSATIVSGTDSVTIDVFPVDDPDVDGNQLVTVLAIASGYLNASGMITVEDDGTDTPVFTELVINELDADQPGTDANEFVELYNKTASPQPLDGLLLVLFNGNGDAVYDVIDLSGHTIEADGFFVIGSATVPGVDLEAFTTNGLQNGADAVALYVGSPADISNGDTPGMITNTLVDAIVYGTDDADDLELLSALTPGGVQANETPSGDDSVSRLPDGGEAFDTSAFQAGTSSPGAANEMLAAGGYADWASANGIAGEPFDGDFDGDGIPNGVEYGIAGLDPAAFDDLSGSFDGATLSYAKNPEAVANGDVSWAIEESGDLGLADPWEAVTPGTDTEALISYTLPAGAGTVFARLQVTQLGAAP